MAERISIVIDINTANGLRQINELFSSLDSLAISADRTISVFRGLEAPLRAAGAAAGRTSERLNDINTAGRRVSETTRRSGDAMSRLAREMRRSESQAQRLAERYADQADGTRRLRRDLVALTRAYRRGQISQQQFEESTQSINDQLNQNTNSAQRSTSAMRGLITVLASFGTVNAVSNLVRINIEFESLNASLGALAGSAETAQQQLLFLQQTSQRLGINVRTLGENFKGLTAAAQGTSLQGAQIEEVFSALTEAGRTLSLSQDDIAGTSRALQQILSKGEQYNAPSHRNMC